MSEAKNLPVESQKKFDVEEFIKYMVNALLDVKMLINQTIVNIIADEILKNFGIKHELICGFKLFKSTKTAISYTWLVINNVKYDITHIAACRIDPQITDEKIEITQSLSSEYMRSDILTEDSRNHYANNVRLLKRYIEGKNIWNEAPENIIEWRKQIRDNYKI